MLCDHIYSFIVEDCKWKWGEYSDCTAPCNGGTKTRYPIITQHPDHGGEECPSHVKQNTSETESCNTHSCTSEL